MRKVNNLSVLTIFFLFKILPTVDRRLVGAVFNPGASTDQAF